MTNIIKCDSCKQEIVKDNTEHICNACQVNRDPKMWKANRHGEDCSLEKENKK